MARTVWVIEGFFRRKFTTRKRWVPCEKYWTLKDARFRKAWLERARFQDREVRSCSGGRVTDSDTLDSILAALLRMEEILERVETLMEVSMDLQSDDEQEGH